MQMETLQKLGYSALNPLQQKALKEGFLDSPRTVVSAPTASGKTLLSLMAIVKHFETSDKPAFYVVPLRALASEKYREFTKALASFDLSVGISTGDFDSSSNELKAYDVVVLTSEKLDSLLRHDSSWLGELGLVVIDEGHLIADGSRGATLEVVMTKLKRSDAKMLVLSATIPNNKEYAEWLGAKLIESDYRPTPLAMGLCDGKNLYMEDETIQKMETPAPLALATLALSEKNNKGQAIFFTSTRRFTESLAKQLKATTFSFLTGEEKAKCKELSEKALKALPTPTSQCKILAECLECGVAFHNAGLCLHPDTEVLLSTGRTIKISELFSDYGKKTIQVVSLNLETMKTKFARVLNVLRRPAPQTLVKLETSSGKELIATREHPLLAIDGEGNLSWLEAGRVGGRAVACPRLFSSASKIPNFIDVLPDDCRALNAFEHVREMHKLLTRKMTETEFARETGMNFNHLHKYGCERNIQLGLLKKIIDLSGYSVPIEKIVQSVSSTSGQGRSLRIPKELPREFLYLAGVAGGDGHISRAGIKIGGKPAEFLVRVQKHIEPALGKISKVSSGTFPELRINSKILAEILVTYFGLKYGKKAQYIHASDLIKELPNKWISEYLKGLFDTDGSVNYRDTTKGSSQIEFCSTSKRMVKDVQLLLIRFGIHSKVISRLHTKKTTVIRGRPVVSKLAQYRLLITGLENLRKFKAEICFLHPKKEICLDTICAVVSEPRSKKDLLPNLGKKLLAIRSSQKASYASITANNFPAMSYWRCENNKNPIERKNLLKLVNHLPTSEEKTYLTKIACSDVIWEPVSRVQEVSSNNEFVYDLEIEGTHNFVSNGLIVHNSSKQREIIEEGFKEHRCIKAIAATTTLAAGLDMPASWVIVRDLKRYNGDFAELIPKIECMQMVGRAGRPRFDKRGVGILMCAPYELRNARDKYIFGELEDIYSQLSSEPSLRAHCLALVASGYSKSFEELFGFFSSTLYAQQYENTEKLLGTVEKVVGELGKRKFIKEKNLKLYATPLGKRVSELYIDPLSASAFLKAMDSGLSDFAFLMTLQQASEARPLLRVKKNEEQRLWEEWFALDEEDEEEALQKYKTAKMMNAWANESSEDEVMKGFDMPPGSLHSRVRIQEWLAYSFSELAFLLNRTTAYEFAKRMRRRLKYGVKEELLPLTSFRGIGRVRARKLWNAGVRTKEQYEALGKDEVRRILKTSGDEELLQEH